MRSDEHEQREFHGDDGRDPDQGSGSSAEAAGPVGIIGVPDGWEIVRIGSPNAGDHFLEYSSGTLEKRTIEVVHTDVGGYWDYLVVVVQRKAHWQKLWHQQWKGTPLQGRFRSHVDDPWQYGTIVRYRPGAVRWQAQNGRWFRYAQIRSKDIPQ